VTDSSRAEKIRATLAEYEDQKGHRETLLVGISVSSSGVMLPVRCGPLEGGARNIADRVRLRRERRRDGG